tara:strand:+ start:389534 stop:390232 length:699 start_codon:yes stop_codon:yes gene_type:complete
MEIRLTKKIDFSNENLHSEFTESDYKGIRDFTEKEIIDFIYRQNFHHLLHAELGFTGSQKIMNLREQKEPFLIKSISSKPGDLDLILFDTEKPDKAVALEVKRVKFKTHEDQSVTTNREKLISEGITQANEYLKIGFNKTYLLIILLDESWQQDKPNSIFKESGLENSPKLINPRVLENLDNNIGLLYMGVRQITPQSVSINTRVDIRAIQDAIKMDQDVRITEVLKKKNEH